MLDTKQKKEGDSMFKSFFSKCIGLCKGSNNNISQESQLSQQKECGEEEVDFSQFVDANDQIVVNVCKNADSLQHREGDPKLEFNKSVQVNDNIPSSEIEIEEEKMPQINGFKIQDHVLKSCPKRIQFKRSTQQTALPRFRKSQLQREQQSIYKGEILSYDNNLPIKRKSLSLTTAQYLESLVKIKKIKIEKQEPGKCSFDELMKCCKPYKPKILQEQQQAFRTIGQKLFGRLQNEEAVDCQAPKIIQPKQSINYENKTDQSFEINSNSNRRQKSVNLEDRRVFINSFYQNETTPSPSPKLKSGSKTQRKLTRERMFTPLIKKQQNQKTNKVKFDQKLIEQAKIERVNLRDKSQDFQASRKKREEYQSKTMIKRVSISPTTALKSKRVTKLDYSNVKSKIDTGIRKTRSKSRRKLNNNA